jgi:hypothetical protein
MMGNKWVAADREQYEQEERERERERERWLRVEG